MGNYKNEAEKEQPKIRQVFFSLGFVKIFLYCHHHLLLLTHAVG